MREGIDINRTAVVAVVAAVRNGKITFSTFSSGFLFPPRPRPYPLPGASQSHPEDLAFRERLASKRSRELIIQKQSKIARPLLDRRPKVEFVRSKKKSEKRPPLFLFVGAPQDFVVCLAPRYFVRLAFSARSFPRTSVAHFGAHQLKPETTVPGQIGLYGTSFSEVWGLSGRHLYPPFFV